MKNNWNVTYEVITHESAEHGDAADRGFEAEDVSFRDAVSFFGYPWLGVVEANCYPVDGHVRWFTHYGDANLASGDVRNLGLHIPEQITASSRLRLARLLKCYGIGGR
jgi:hypothetical protein